MLKLKDKVREIVEIAKECPENLQVICFELLLKNHLETFNAKQTDKPSSESAVGKDGKSEDATSVQQNNPSTPPNSDDIAERELHAKTKAFMAKRQITIEQINTLYYKEGGEVKTLFDSLQTTRMSEGQIRIALLQALQNGLTTGDFATTVENVRSEATDRKYYDPNNFSKNFKNNAALFDFDQFDKSVQTLKLSENGKDELAKIVKELQ